MKMLFYFRENAEISNMIYEILINVFNLLKKINLHFLSQTCSFRSIINNINHFKIVLFNQKIITLCYIKLFNQCLFYYNVYI